MKTTHIDVYFPTSNEGHSKASYSATIIEASYHQESKFPYEVSFQIKLSDNTLWECWAVHLKELKSWKVDDRLQIEIVHEYGSFYARVTNLDHNNDTQAFLLGWTA